MCPVACLLILISYPFQRKKRNAGAPDQILKSKLPFGDWRYFFFGLAGLAYSLSLVLFTRYFIAGLSASIAHILLRNIFSVAVILLFTILGKREKIVIIGQLALIAAMVVLAIVNPNHLVSFYYWEFFYCPTSCGIATFYLFKERPKRVAIILFRRLLLAWTLLQILDALLLWTGVGAYSAPSLIVLMSLTALYIGRIERENLDSINVSSGKILTVIESNIAIKSVLQEVAVITMRESKYGRVSSYVDGFCIGATESPGRSFFRVSEEGYKKDTTKDSVISFSEGRGAIMSEALSLARPILRTGLTDGAWFLVVPIGKHACINLSDDKPKSDFLAYESLEILQRIFLSLLSLERRLIDLGFQQGAAFAKVEIKEGRWPLG